MKPTLETTLETELVLTGEQSTSDTNGTDECKVYSQAGFTATMAWDDGGV